METILGEVILLVPFLRSDTKYRDIADGNICTGSVSPGAPMTSDTKYRDIADGNVGCVAILINVFFVRYQVPRYSGWKREPDASCASFILPQSDTKYRDIADGNLSVDVVGVGPKTESDTKYRDIADGNSMTVLIVSILSGASDTKYRDIADGNCVVTTPVTRIADCQIPSTAI